jgi:REP element-mobilizing transposase RayT
MPRGPRLDAPDVLHHVIIRGIERRRIFRCDADRRRCLDRLGTVVGLGGARLYAWCLMPNQVHALIRTGPMPLSRVIQRWAGAYAVAFNRRYARVGHLFQNRFKSIVVDEEQYLLELVRYIRLNPVRARRAIGLDDLDDYPWTGHAVLVGRRAFAAQDTAFVLERFGRPPAVARQAYREFVRTAVTERTSLDLTGGALRPRSGGWEYLGTLRHGREQWSSDERILGARPFIRGVVGQCRSLPAAPADRAAQLHRMSVRVAERFGVTAEQIASPSLRRRVLRARAVVCHLAVTRLGFTLHSIGRALGISPQSVMRAVERGGPEIANLADIEDLLG